MRAASAQTLETKIAEKTETEIRIQSLPFHVEIVFTKSNQMGCWEGSWNVTYINLATNFGCWTVVYTIAILCRIFYFVFGLLEFPHNFMQHWKCKQKKWSYRHRQPSHAPHDFMKSDTMQFRIYLMISTVNIDTVIRSNGIDVCVCVCWLLIWTRECEQVNLFAFKPRTRVSGNPYEMRSSI